MEARAQVERLERARRRVDERVYSGALVECVSKKTQLATMVAEAEEMNHGMRQLKGCMDAMETRIGQIQAWTEAMEERMERGETYSDEVEIVPVYTANEMLKAMTEEVASVTSASQGRAVTLETFVKGEYVSVSVAARGGSGGNDVARGRENRRFWDSQVDGDPGPVEVSRRSDNPPPPPHRTMRGRRTSGPYHPGFYGGPSGGGEARMNCSGNKRGRK